MAKKPEDRYPSAASVREELLQWVAGEPALPLDKPDDREYQEAVAAVDEDDRSLTGVGFLRGWQNHGRKFQIGRPDDVRRSWEGRLLHRATGLAIRRAGAQWKGKPETGEHQAHPGAWSR